jgi:hypothetical protein
VASLNVLSADWLKYVTVLSATYKKMSETSWYRTGKTVDTKRKYVNVSSGAVGQTEVGPTFGYHATTTGHYERWVYVSNGVVTSTDKWEYVITGFDITAYFDDYHLYIYNAN